jgi:hypothetical protein
MLLSAGQLGQTKLRAPRVEARLNGLERPQRFVQPTRSASAGSLRARNVAQRPLGQASGQVKPREGPAHSPPRRRTPLEREEIATSIVLVDLEGGALRQIGSVALENEVAQ